MKKEKRKANGQFKGPAAYKAGKKRKTTAKQRRAARTAGLFGRVSRLEANDKRQDAKIEQCLRNDRAQSEMIGRLAGAMRARNAKRRKAA